MEKTKQRFTPREVETIVRFFTALEHQIEIAYLEGRSQDAGSMCRLNGSLQVKIFGFNHTPMNNPAFEVAA